MKKIYSIVPILFIALLLSKCETDGNSKLPVCDTKDKFVVAKLKIIITDVFPTEESNGNQVISNDLINLLQPSGCDCADEKPLIINSDIYRVDTAAHQKIFNYNDVSKFSGDTRKLKFWQNKTKILKDIPLIEPLLLPANTNNVLLKIGSFILKNSKEDSVFVLANSTKKYLLNGKSYRSFDNIDSVRKNIEQIYQKNPKINFTIILNPPTEESAIVNCTNWIATGNQKFINNVSHIEEKCETGEVRWVKGGNSNRIKKVNGEKAIKVNANLPPPLRIEGIKEEAIKEGNTKDLKLKSRTNQ